MDAEILNYNFKQLHQYKSLQQKTFQTMTMILKKVVVAVVHYQVISHLNRIMMKTNIQQINLFRKLRTEF